jgi:hypothetical protein
LDLETKTLGFIFQLPPRLWSAIMKYRRHEFWGGLIMKTRLAIFNTKKGEANEPEHSPGKKIEN